MNTKNNKNNEQATREQIEKLEAFYFEMCGALRQFSFRPRFTLYPAAEKIEVIRKYIRVLDILDIRVPEIDPLIADLLKSNLILSRKVWAACTNRPEK